MILMQKSDAERMQSVGGEEKRQEEMNDGQRDEDDQEAERGSRGQALVGGVSGGRTSAGVAQSQSLSQYSPGLLSVSTPILTDFWPQSFI
ncbi:hypothetical protein CC85DRAFT_47404 [Cutaneotrichosporon oleaginosum]|uniref:Uncharacterized protein n=1 Tax=Cutaneotrichosporon oleaginosum TaxID=879819 RepID=A0A0J0XQW3_9TREE|nr:uncharacterized protein CC85DRAFT_47404 [Cutaneotrichosporon oleaginosum]KLT43467.1 hypothetical protein CC85DRAFT_47404 [Cutaneotrichosporon oleaginosum]TXT05627.1 hypothetical protein COLE_06947 [Cutaneotrichosporon oleaginosum]